jgi:hypothetical protein
MEHLMERLQAEHPDSAVIVQRYAPIILRVLPGSMEEFQAGLCAEHGSYLALADHLGVAESVDRLRATVLTDD